MAPYRKPPHWLHAALAVLLAVMGFAIWLASDSQVDDNGRQVSRPSPQTSPPVIYENPIDPGLAVINGWKKLYKGLTAPAKRRKNGIALIMDDVGYDPKAVRRILALPYPVAISILPNAPYARQTAKQAHAAGQIVMLHQPMEPANPHYRGRMDNSFIRASMSKPRVRKMMFDSLKRVPHVVGVNNHMGSHLTTLAAPMNWVMDVCHELGLFFVDSRTSMDSVAAPQAKKAGIRWGQRQVFLDHKPEPGAMHAAWQAAMRYLKRDGFCIVIAHPYAETLSFLEHRIPEREWKQIVPITELLQQGDES